MDLRQLEQRIAEGTYDVPAEEVAIAILRWFIPTDLELVPLDGHAPPQPPPSEPSEPQAPRRALERIELLRVWRARRVRESLLGVRGCAD